MAQLVHFERLGLLASPPGPRSEGRASTAVLRHADGAPYALDPAAIMACPPGVSRAHLPAGRSARHGNPHLAVLQYYRHYRRHDLNHDQHSARHPR
jgi:hypothetical protein